MFSRRHPSAHWALTDWSRGPQGTRSRPMRLPSPMRLKRAPQVDVSLPHSGRGSAASKVGPPCGPSDKGRCDRGRKCGPCVVQFGIRTSHELSSQSDPLCRSLGYIMDYRKRFAVKSDGTGRLGRIDHNCNDDNNDSESQRLGTRPGSALVAAHCTKRFVRVRSTPCGLTPVIVRFR